MSQNYVADNSIDHQSNVMDDNIDSSISIDNSSTFENENRTLQNVAAGRIVANNTSIEHQTNEVDDNQDVVDNSVNDVVDDDPYVEKTPVIFLRTIIKEVPEEITEMSEYRTFRYDLEGNAHYVQPTVPMIVDLEVISDAKYDRMLQEEEAHIWIDKGNAEQVKAVSLNKAAEDITNSVDSDGAITEFLFKKTEENTLNRLWNDLINNPRPFLRISNEDANKKRSAGVRRYHLATLLHTAEAREEMIKAYGNIMYLEQCEKIQAKAQRKVAFQYIRSSDPRLHNRSFHMGRDSQNNDVIHGNHVFLATDMVEVLQQTHQQNSLLLKTIQEQLENTYAKHGDIDENDLSYIYAEDFIKLVVENNQFENNVLAKWDKEDLKVFNNNKEEIESLKARQVAFMRDNCFFEIEEYQIGNVVVHMGAEAFPTEYDYCVHLAMQRGLKKELADLNKVLENAEQFIGVNDKSPIFIAYRKNGKVDPNFGIITEPKLVFPLDYRAFIKTKRFYQDDFKKSERRNNQSRKTR